MNDEFKRSLAENSNKSKEGTSNSGSDFPFTSAFLLEMFRKGNLETGIKPFLIAPIKRKEMSKLSVDWNYGDSVDRVVSERIVKPANIEIKRVKLIQPVYYTKDVEEVPKDVLLKFKRYSQKIEFKSIIHSKYYDTRCNCYYKYYPFLILRNKGIQECDICLKTRKVPIPLSEF